MHRLNRLIQIILLFLFFVPIIPATAQTEYTRAAVDMMVVIDNSCSMFPVNQILAGCDAYGSDVSFLRIAGANLFIARLGFGETNEENYQLGVISMGGEPELVSPLQPLTGMRDSLAGLISKPKAQPASQMVPALELAYAQLKESAVGTHTPAIVMITDGVPWPRETQSDEVIEKLVSSHEDTPLFIMLLQNKDKVSSDYESYIQFWERLQGNYHHIFVYNLRQAEEIQSTYNAILGQLQNTIPAEAAEVKAQIPLRFFVSNYLEKVVITIIRPNARSSTRVTITDANNVDIGINDDGVEYFKGVENPVDVYSIKAARLLKGGRSQYWTVESNRDVTVLIDREGAYRVNLLSPESVPINLAGVFALVDRQSPSVELRIRFNLLNSEGDPVLELQPIRGSVILPNGSTRTVEEFKSLKPDLNGVYEIGYSLDKTYPSIETTPGRFTFIIEAGISDELDQDSPPITSSQVRVDAGKLPFIRSVAPLPVVCDPGQPATLRVNIADYEAALKDTIKVTLDMDSSQIQLDYLEPGIYQGELGSVCAELTQIQGCSSEQVDDWHIDLEAQLEVALPMHLDSREVQVQVVGLECTPTPIPTMTPTPLPEPTPYPDSDSDGVNDAEDRCPELRGWKAEAGCIPWNNLASGLGILGVVVFSSAYLLPWVKVRSFGEPPQGYILVVRDGKPENGVLDLHKLGMKKRVSRLKVGSDYRSHISIPGLKPVELYIERKSVVTYMKEVSEKNAFAFLTEDVQIIHTSDPRLILKVSLNSSRLEE